MNKKKKIIIIGITTVIFLVITELPQATAKWKLPIRPGDYVIDFGRLKDNIKNTEEWSKLVFDAARKATNQILINTGINTSAIVSNIHSISESVSSIVYSTVSMINIGKGIEDFSFSHSNDYRLRDVVTKCDKKVKELHIELGGLTSDELLINGSVIKANRQYEQESKNLIANISEGNLGNCK